LGKTVREIITPNPMLRAPPSLSVTKTLTIRDLVGDGYLTNPWQFKNMYFEGYVWDRDNGSGREPFYKGLLKCDESPHVIEGRVPELKALVEDEDTTCNVDLREGICGCEFPCDSSVNPCADGFICAPDKTCVPKEPTFIQRGCTLFEPRGNGYTRMNFRFPNRLPLEKGNAETCSNMCSERGFPFFGFECPNQEGVLCQCYTDARVGRNLPAVLDCKSFVDTEFPHTCTESGMVDGISMGGAWIGSIYEVPQ